MLLLDDKQTKDNNNLDKPLLDIFNISSDHKSHACFYDDLTLVCGNIKNVDYFVRIESKMIPEPFYGDIDIFGF
jgi:hypothetical protein